MANPVTLTAARQLKTIGTEVGEGALLKGTIAYAFAPNSPRHADRCLREAAHFRRGSRRHTLRVGSQWHGSWKIPFTVRKGQPFERCALQKFTDLRMTFDAQDLGKHWGDDFKSFSLFARTRLVIDPAYGWIEAPFAWRIQTFQHTFDVV